MSAKPFLARNLAAAFLTGPWSAAAMLRQGALACGRREKWLQPLIRRVLRTFVIPATRTWELLAAFIEADAGFDSAWREACWAGHLPLHHLFWVTPEMAPTAGHVPWPVPALTTTSALAQWLGLEPFVLEWFADRHGWEAKAAPESLRHYTYRWLPKTGGQWRLLEVPKARLKQFQRRILREVLDVIPPHDAAHGYCRGRSIATFVAPHCGRRIVLRFDLRDFFPSVPPARIHALFVSAGYPRDVARLLTGLCTNVVPDDIWSTVPSSTTRPVPWATRQRFRAPHLPQGAPTSPALANLGAYRLDCRLTGLAQSFGAVYTRYADDLAFSGGIELERASRHFAAEVGRIAADEGFVLHPDKARFMRRGVRQQLVGIVVNEQPNLRRDDYDRLKALLYNCVRYGAASQNREKNPDFQAHLRGRVAHAVLLNPARGERLLKLLDSIDADSWARMA